MTIPSRIVLKKLIKYGYLEEEPTFAIYQLTVVDLYELCFVQAPVVTIS
jgi:hypothetical protein